MKDMTEEEKMMPGVAILAGDSKVIELIVKTASKESGIHMNWGYVAGRAVVHSNGDKAKCRAAILQAIPITNIENNERYA